MGLTERHLFENEDVPENYEWALEDCEAADNAFQGIYNVLKAMKERGAVEPTFKQDNDGIFVWACGSCGAYMYHIYDGIDKAKEYAKYCRQCGKKVKWE